MNLAANRTRLIISMTPQIMTYSQLFRSGALEFVHTYGVRNREKIIPGASYKEFLLKTYRAGIKVLRKLKIEPPLIEFSTLVNAKGYRLSVGQIEKKLICAIQYRLMLIPDVEIERPDQKDILVLKLLFDIVWN